MKNTAEMRRERRERTWREKGWSYLQ